MQSFEDFVKEAGTYLKVVRFGETMNPDGFIVLYLRPNNLFLLLGYWRGYERSQPMGRWVKHGVNLHLDGHGQLSADFFAPAHANARFERSFSVKEVVHTPYLVTSKEMKKLSLLGWRGTFTYAGQHTIIDPDGEWLPASLSDVDRLIEKGVGPK
ncbi:MAG: hypothetical protein LJE96_17685 [Deltaproteobacteria bacterium]|nr:hypothetical protein [Deltaproteobacteria bacterium]